MGKRTIAVMSQANNNPASMKTMTKSKAKYSQLVFSNESFSSTSSDGTATAFVVSVEAVSVESSEDRGMGSTSVMERLSVM